MEFVLAPLVGLTVAAAVYLILSRALIRVLLGIVLLGNGVNLLIFVAGTNFAAALLLALYTMSDSTITLVRRAASRERSCSRSSRRRSSTPSATTCRPR